MNFPSIDIQGSILSNEILGKIRSEQAGHQQGKDFSPELSTAKLKDEISLAWQEAKGQWKIFKSKLSRLKEGETGTTETRNFWISPLLTNLGYNLTYSSKAEELNGKSFSIRYRDSSLDNFPVYVGGYNESLDKRPENKSLRVSPHALMQEYLNYSEHLYGLVTNGRQLRLLRDASRITRLSYVEFNLEKIMEEDLYSDFVILFRLLHASRMPKRIDGGAESIIEQYHHEGLEAGSTIRSNLGKAVKTAIQNLANGFINHPDNTELRKTFEQGHLDTDEYYRHMLRIIYRLLFLFVIEERNLVYANSNTLETKRFSQIYFNYYSLLRLRKLAKKLPPPEANRHYDLWQSLVSTFSLYEKKEIGEKLGIMALQGDLFSYNAIKNEHYDLHQCYLSNVVLLNIIKSLTYFENENIVLIAVNYGGLDVEEFGSVYEGLLELKLKIEPIVGTDNYRCSFEESSERSKSGSHYTPEELVQPLIKHSLDYLIADKLKEKDPEAGLLSLKVCDVACGSGHILLSAARRIALELASLQETKASGSKEKVEQPSPAYVRIAMKEVIKNCIYGVDKNPLAVELCKIALWLESYNPGEPLNFLDHHIKCGDAIVGLAHREELENGIAKEAFKTLSGDDKNIAKSFRDKNNNERKGRPAKAIQLKADFEKTTENSVLEVMTEYKTFNQLPETTPDEIGRKAKAYHKFLDGKGFTFLKAMADTQVAQFFIPKTDANKDSLMTDGDFRLILRGYKGWQDRKVAKATAVGWEQRFFHWFLEFPQVFNEGGFDCILGNPPFLGDRRLKEAYGDEFLEWIRFNFTEGATVDLVVYFFLRINSILRAKGFQSLISTNTVAQGKAREFGLEKLIANGSILNHAVKGMKWPGLAAVEVSLITLFKGVWKEKFYLNGKEINQISPFLDEADNTGTPFPLFLNEGKSFQGSIILGKGFVLEPNEAEYLVTQDEKNNTVIFPYLNGDDLNNNPNQSPSRFVINFFDWIENKAATYSEPYNILLERVKPERQRWRDDKDGNPIIGEYALRHPLPEKWWQHCEKRPALYNETKKLKRVLVSCRVSKYVNQSFIEVGAILDVATSVVIRSEYWEYAFLQSSFHNHWAWKYGSTMKFDIRYTNRDCIDTFPISDSLPTEIQRKLETIGETYHEHRRQLMLSMQLGLTKTYNAFHAKEIQPNITTAILQSMEKKSIEKEYGKEVWYLWNHLQKMKHAVKGEAVNVCSIEEAIAGIVKLRELHVEMDNAVLEAYGWGADSAQPIELKHDFYEVDYLPENDRVRFTIHPVARKEVLKRLLELNHQIHEEELKAGLWDKKGKKKYRDSEERGNTVDEPDSSYGGLFKQ